MAEEARAWRGANAFRLVRYLSDRPDALRRPSSDCPTCVVRLPAVLTAVGHGDKVALVPCGDCGRTRPSSHQQRTGGASVFTPRRPTCQEAVRPLRQSGRHLCPPTGGRHLQSVREQGAGCQGGMRRLPPDDDLLPAPARRRQPLPDLCSQERSDLLPLRTGTPGQRPDLRRAGPRRLLLQPSPTRLCGVCGQIVPIVARADGTRPDTCDRCYKRHEKTCAICERVRPGHHINGGLGPFHCDTCRPREECACALCGRIGKVKVFWPKGPVCDPWYRTALSTPAPCASCNRHRIPIGQRAEGRPLCKACSRDRRRDLLIMETPSDEVTRVRTLPEPSVYSLALAATAQALLAVRGLHVGVAPDALKELVAAAARRPGRRNLRPRR